MSKSAQILPVFYFLVDVTVLVLAFFSTSYFVHQHDYNGLQWIILASLIGLWFIIGYTSKLYRVNLHNGLSQRMISYTKSYLIYAVLIVSLIYLSTQFPIAVSKVLFAFVIGFLVLNITVNCILINIISRVRRKADNLRYALVAGAGDLAQSLSDYFNSNPDYGYQIKGFVRLGDEEPKVSANKVVGTVDEIKSYLENNAVDEIVIALPYDSPKTTIKSIIDQADFHGVRVSYVPDYQGLFGKNFQIKKQGELNTINVRQLPLDEIYAAIEKGVFDFIFASIVLLLLSPVLLVIAILIKLDSRGPVFYCPTRVGRGGRNFKLYKFRSMTDSDSSNGGTMSTKKNDPRITKIGRVLRKYSLDELPQFLNVFLGEMSVVGPRPHRNFLNQQMKEHVDKYMLRYYFKPGITGWAQVNGWRGPTETEEQISQRTSHDLWYIENWSFILDIKIVWLTIFGRKTHENAF